MKLSALTLLVHRHAHARQIRTRTTTAADADAAAHIVLINGTTTCVLCCPGSGIRKAASTTTLGGVAFNELTATMKTIIEDKIMAQVGAQSIEAEYSTAARRGRRLAAGDTVVEWEAMFADKATASAAREADVAAFQTGLKAALEAEDSFQNVVVSTTVFKEPLLGGRSRAVHARASVNTHSRARMQCAIMIVHSLPFAEVVNPDDQAHGPAGSGRCDNEHCASGECCCAYCANHCNSPEFQNGDAVRRECGKCSTWGTAQCHPGARGYPGTCPLSSPRTAASFRECPSVPAHPCSSIRALRIPNVTIASSG